MSNFNPIILPGKVALHILHYAICMHITTINITAESEIIEDSTQNVTNLAKTCLDGNWVIINKK